MDEKKHGLSSSVKRIVERLFSDPLFKEEALANPELAFANYSLDEEERQSLKSLLVRVGRRYSIFEPADGVWW